MIVQQRGANAREIGLTPEQWRRRERQAVKAAFACHDKQYTADLLPRCNRGRRAELRRSLRLQLFQHLTHMAMPGECWQCILQAIQPVTHWTRMYSPRAFSGAAAPRPG